MFQELTASNASIMQIEEKEGGRAKDGGMYCMYGRGVCEGLESQL